MQGIVRTAPQIRSKGSRGRIFIAPELERGRANHHPCPLLKGGGLRRKLSRYFMGITDFT